MQFGEQIRTHPPSGRGVPIGKNKMLKPKHQIMAEEIAFCQVGTSCTYRAVGPWVGATKRFLGLRFTIKGKVHYGWARLNVTAAPTQVTATLTGYAYETTPNKAIITGKTKGVDVGTVERSLGHLALGAKP